MKTDDIDKQIATYLASRTNINSSRAAVVRIANETLRDTFGEDLIHLPVDLEKVGKTLKVMPPFSTPAIGADAILLPNGDYFQLNLKVGTGITAERKRFSWAHELCHTFFYERQNGSFARAVPSGSQLEEDLCDLGAQTLLLPTNLFMQLMEDIRGPKTISEEIIEKAKKAEVSLQVFLIRARMLSYWENFTFAIFSTDVKRHGSPFKLMWQSIGEKCRYRVIQDTILPPSLLHKAFAIGGTHNAVLCEQWIKPDSGAYVEARRYSKGMLLVCIRQPRRNSRKSHHTR